MTLKYWNRHCWYFVRTMTTIERDANGILKRYWNSIGMLMICKYWNRNCSHFVRRMTKSERDTNGVLKKHWSSFVVTRSREDQIRTKNEKCDFLIPSRGPVPANHPPRTTHLVHRGLVRRLIHVLGIRRGNARVGHGVPPSTGRLGPSRPHDSLGDAPLGAARIERMWCIWNAKFRIVDISLDICKTSFLSWTETSNNEENPFRILMFFKCEIQNCWYFVRHMHKQLPVMDGDIQ